MSKVQAYIDAHRERMLAELAEYCAQPSVAATGTGLEEAAAVVEKKLRNLGANTRRIQVDKSAPILYGEIGHGPRSLMIYNHYDVQPAEPLEEWDSPPFELARRNGRLYARGVADCKGDLMARLQAVEAYQATVGPLPLRLKFVVEGEEEVGSPHLDAFGEQYADLIQADGCLWESGQKDEARRPTLSLGLKGICYVELKSRTAETDLHSMYGGIIPNAAWRLTWALNSLKDPEDRIRVDGLMEQAVPPREDELAHLESFPYDEAQVRANFGFQRFVRDLTGVELLVQYFYAPTCTICGLTSGYQGPGLKTVLPHEASAKVDFRLVPDLTPALVMDLLRRYLDRQGFSDIEIRQLSGLLPARTALDAEIVQASEAAARIAHGQAPVIYPILPGSGPMHALCRGIPAVLAGVGHANARYHAPNENIFEQDYFEGIHFVAELIRGFAT